MKHISIKLEPEFLSKIERAIKKFNFTTKSEFIREAIRDKFKKLKIK